MGLFDDDYDDDCQNSRTYTTVRKAAKIANDPTKHYPNKDEAQELRKIMASTGLSEEEVRQDPKYRKQLSEAQKAGQKAKRTEAEMFYQKIIKEACKKTGLVPQHPETLKAIDIIIKEREGRSWGRRFFLYHNLKSAKTIVKYYAK
ncbi:MAG: hypothetical protein WC428_02365 [Candidatus Paceibacterota bacterium]